MMYFASVNRGLSLTKPGQLTTLLVLAIGMIAMASALNAIFLSVSFLIALIIVSGILSERVVKNLKLANVSPVRTVAKSNFELPISVQTNSLFPGLAGIELQFFSHPKQGLGSFQKSFVLQEKIETWQVSLSGLERGRYSRLRVLARTTFPFGILYKFRWFTVDTDLLAFPERVLEFEEHLARNLELFKGRNDNKDVFFGHRSYQNRDPVRFIDWKKSAGRDVSHWVTREYHGEKPTKKYLIDPDWQLLRFQTSETAYERQLALVATAIHLLSEENQTIEMLLSDGTVENNAAKALELLACLPHHSQATDADFPGNGKKAETGALVISIGHYREFL